MVNFVLSKDEEGIYDSSQEDTVLPTPPSHLDNISKVTIDKYSISSN